MPQTQSSKEPLFFPGFFKGKGRPDHHIEDVKRAVVLKVLPAILSWLGETLDPKDEDDQSRLDEIQDDLLDVVCYSQDGYAMTKELEDDKGWADADSELVDILDNLEFYSIGNAAIIQWIADNEVKPKLAAGAIVRVKQNRHRKEEFTGEIIQVEDSGNYVVLIPSQGHVREGVGTHGWCIPWEEVEALNP